jgi:hypothetical protein
MDLTGNLHSALTAPTASLMAAAPLASIGTPSSTRQPVFGNGSDKESVHGKPTPANRRRRAAIRANRRRRMPSLPQPAMQTPRQNNRTLTGEPCARSAHLGRSPSPRFERRSTDPERASSADATRRSPGLERLCGPRQANWTRPLVHPPAGGRGRSPTSGTSAVRGGALVGGAGCIRRRLDRARSQRRAIPTGHRRVPRGSGSRSVRRSR